VHLRRLRKEEVMIPRDELQAKIRSIGWDDMWIGIGNVESAATLIRRWPQDLVMACANMGVCVRCLGADRGAFLALLNHTDPSDPGATELNLIAGEIDAAYHDASNLSRALEQERQQLTSLRQPGDPIGVNQLLERIEALHQTLQAIAHRLHRFTFPACPCPTSASHPSEVPSQQECPCHAV
jgi:hypothetical protein